MAGEELELSTWLQWQSWFVQTDQKSSLQESCLIVKGRYWLQGKEAGKWQAARTATMGSGFVPLPSPLCWLECLCSHGGSALGTSGGSGADWSRLNCAHQKKKKSLFYSWYWSSWQWAVVSQIGEEEVSEVSFMLKASFSAVKNIFCGFFMFAVKGIFLTFIERIFTESFFTSWNVWKMVFHSVKIFQITWTDMFKKCCQLEIHSLKNHLHAYNFK